MAQMSQGGGVDTCNTAVTHHYIEHTQDGLRLADKQIIIAQVNQRAAELKFVITWPRLFVSGERQNGLIEQLQQHMIQFGYATSDAKEILHHMFDRLVPLTDVIQALGDAALAVKQQTVVIAVEFKVQGEADTPEQVQTFIKLVAFGFG